MLDGASVKMVPVSDDHPLSETKHYVAATAVAGVDKDCDGDSMRAFYQRMGVVLMETVMDGDCGVDCACRMLGLASTREARKELREDFWA